MTGRLIAFEGGEGSGKTTQARRLAEYRGAVFTFEPGATQLGAQIRSMVLDGDGPPVSPHAEALLMAADRAQHVDEVIRPALSAGRDVVTDRFIGSSLAYQGWGRGLDHDEVLSLSHFAVAGLVCDLVVLLEVSEQTARARLQGQPGDRIEAEALEFHRKVEQGYRALAERNPEHWVVIDGDRPEDVVAAEVAAVVGDRLDG